MIRYAALGLLLLLTGCANGDAQGPTPDPSAKNRVAVTVARTGGIAGVRDTVTVDTTGEWTRPTSTDSTKSGQLSADQITKVQQLATDPKLVTEAATVPGPSKCADAFNYAVTAGGLTVHYVDCPSDNFKPAAAMALVDYINKSVAAS